MSEYRFTQVDTDDEEVVELLNELHQLTFVDTAALPEWDYGWWWIGWHRRSAAPAAFCGVVQSSLEDSCAYLKRAGVVQGHNGYGLQRRMIRMRERRARRLGFIRMITDTTDNYRSANNLIAEGYRLFNPEPWAWEHSLYWTKAL
jgi:GNAT superfamily N-acetyltransferase